MSLAETRVLFIATIDPRRETGHFAQYLSVARALGVRPLVAVPGSRSAAEAALALGADVIADATPALIEKLRADIVVVDDPVAAQVTGWIIAAQRAGALVVTAEDLGFEARTRAAVLDSRAVVSDPPAFLEAAAAFGAHQ
jgi:D-arabinose 1-dehydrogenase-like Zn-dependent alcohol dehydrogenase